MGAKKIILLSLILLGAVGVLIYSAVQASAKEVLTVAKLVGAQPQKNIRLGARVCDANIQYQTEPEFLLSFVACDIINPTKSIKVTYKGIMPDTLKNDRDVILEGDYQSGELFATNLMTQCPSKYEPPTPEG